MRYALSLVTACLLSRSLAAQILVKAGRLMDGRAEAPRAAVGILIEGDRIRAVGPVAQIQGQPMVDHQRRAFGQALKKGVRMVLGTDVGGFPWTDLNEADITELERVRFVMKGAVTYVSP